MALYHKSKKLGYGTTDVATTTKAGLVKPDGTSIKVNPDGTIYSVGGGDGADGLDFDEDTRELTLLQGTTELDKVTISGGDVPDIVTAWEDTTVDTKIPSEKLVKDSLDNKVDKVDGKGLSTVDFTDTSYVHTDNNYDDDAVTEVGKIADKFDSANVVTSFTYPVSDAKVPSEKLVSETFNGKASATLVNNAIGTSSAYSPSKSYAVDDYCIYNDKLYCCILATTAGIAPTNTTYWKEVSLSSLNSNLTQNNGIGSSWGEKVSLKDYNSKTSPYNIPSNGVITMRCVQGDYNYILLYGVDYPSTNNVIQMCQPAKSDLSDIQTVAVSKGMKVWCTVFDKSLANEIYFIPYK